MKRRKRIQLTFIYLLMAVAVVSIVAILLLVIQGYRYNRFDGKLEQGGLVQFDSRPSGATVTVDDITLANRTASKVTLSSGQHTVTMSREGYSTWRKNVVVKPGSILWLNYTRLFPTSPKNTTSTSFDTISSALVSPDKKTMAVLTKSDIASINLVPLDTDTPKTTVLTIPATGLSAPGSDQAQSFSLMSWDADSNLLLLKHVYGESTEYLSFDTRSSTVHNISRELGVSVAKILYSLSDSNVLYVLTTTGELRRISLDSATLSGPLASDVQDIMTTEERVLFYTTKQTADVKPSIGYITAGASKAKVLGTYDDTSLRAASATYYGQHYIVLQHGETLTISKGGLPASDSNDAVKLSSVANLKVKGDFSYIGFSPEEHRFVYVAGGNTVVTYDLELLASATVSLQNALTRDVSWLDGYHLLATGQNSYYYDFDGTNSQLFASNTIDMPATLSPNEKFIYYFAPAKTGVVLRRVALTTD